MKEEKTIKISKWVVLFRVVICGGILASGVWGMQTLADMKTPPAEKVIKETALQVKTVQAQYENVQTWISGYGEVSSLNVVAISPEIAGRITMIHPRLEKGEKIRKGETLFQVDTLKDRLVLKNSQKRLKTFQRNLALAQNAYERTKRLYEKNKIGTLSNVENAEKEYNSLIDQIGQLQLSIDSAVLNLNKAIIKAPFDARVKQVNLEKGQYVSPGSISVILADDSILEIEVSLDADKAMRLLQFKNSKKRGKGGSLPKLKRVPARVTWSQGSNQVQVTGQLHRILEFDATTRTLKVAIQIHANSSKNRKNQPFPILEGMFCKVEIPGKTLFNVIRLPEKAVKSNGSVHVVVQNRLKTVSVNIGDRSENEVLISGGINSNDQVIITQLATPLENTLVEPIVVDQLAQSVRR